MLHNLKMQEVEMVVTGLSNSYKPWWQEDWS